MPIPTIGFPIAPFAWPHVGAQWPVYNIESPQARGLVGWWPPLASERDDILRNLLTESSEDWQGGQILPDRDLGRVWDGDGISDHVSLNPAILPSGYPLSITIWIRTTTLGTDVAFSFGNSVDNASLIIFQQSGANGIKYFVRDDLSVLASADSTSNVLTGKVFMITGVSESSSSHKIYVNGRLEDTDTTAVTFPVLNTITYGALERIAVEFHWPDQLGEARVYNRSLTATEVLEQFINPWDLYTLPPRRWVLAPAPAVGAIMNQIQFGNVGADLFNGTLL